MFSLVLLLSLGFFSFNASGGACPKSKTKPNWGHCNKHEIDIGDFTITKLKCDEFLSSKTSVKWEGRCYLLLKMK